MLVGGRSGKLVNYLRRRWRRINGHPRGFADGANGVGRWRRRKYIDSFSHTGKVVAHNPAGLPGQRYRPRCRRVSVLAVIGVQQFLTAIGCHRSGGIDSLVFPYWVPPPHTTSTLMHCLFLKFLYHHHAGDQYITPLLFALTVTNKAFSR